MVKGTEDNDYERLRRLGFQFDGQQNDYAFQPDSGSVIGGVRGRQEYGIEGEVAADTYDLEHADIGEETPLEFDADPVPYGDPASDPVGSSEWSNLHALQEEEIVEQMEPYDFEERDQHAYVPRTYRRSSRRRITDDRRQGEERREPPRTLPRRTSVGTVVTYFAGGALAGLAYHLLRRRGEHRFDE